MTMHSGEPQGSRGSARTMVPAADTVNQRQPESGQGKWTTQDTQKPTGEEILVTSTLDSEETPDGDKKTAAAEDFQASGTVTQDPAVTDRRIPEQSQDVAKGHRCAIVSCKGNHDQSPDLQCMSCSNEIHSLCALQSKLVGAPPNGWRYCSNICKREKEEWAANPTDQRCNVVHLVLRSTRWEMQQS